MSIAYRLIQQLRNGGGMFSGGEGDGDLYSAGVEGALDLMESGGQFDSGAVGDRLRTAIGNWQAKRGANLSQRGAGTLAKVNGPAAPVQQLATTVAETQLGAEARRAINKSRYKLYRIIPLLSVATIAAAGTGVIAVTPTSKCFAEYIVANGVFRVDTLTMMGQTLLPNGPISTAPFQGTNNGLMPVNLYLDTVPISGGVTNNSAAAVYASLDMQVWMEAAADSERY